MVRRQALGPHLVREAEPAKVFHGACLRGVGLRIGRGARLRVHQQGADAAPPQFDGEHQAARAAARDEHVGRQGWKRLVHLRS
jgi:hypothetical protein